MIGQIRGTLVSKATPEVLVDVQGVGYEDPVANDVFLSITRHGRASHFGDSFVVREDAQLLYGFNSLAERSLFRLLIKTQGVGPKLALAILSGMNADEFVWAVNQNDVSRLVKLPGVGKKTAERLVIEMRDRLKDWQGSSTPATDAAPLDNISGDALVLRLMPVLMRSVPCWRSVISRHTQKRHLKPYTSLAKAAKRLFVVR